MPFWSHRQVLKCQWPRHAGLQEPVTVSHYYTMVNTNRVVQQPKTLGLQDPATDPCLKAGGRKLFARDSNRRPFTLVKGNDLAQKNITS